MIVVSVRYISCTSPWANDYHDVKLLSKVGCFYLSICVWNSKSAAKQCWKKREKCSFNGSSKCCHLHLGQTMMSWNQWSIHVETMCNGLLYLSISFHRDSHPICATDWKYFLWRQEICITYKHVPKIFKRIASTAWIHEANLLYVSSSHSCCW